MNLLIPGPYCYIVGAVIWILIIGTFVRDWTQDYNQTHPRPKRPASPPK